MFGNHQFNTILFNAGEAGAPPGLLSVTSNPFSIIAVEVPFPPIETTFPSDASLEIRVKVRDNAMRLRAQIEDYEYVKYQRDWWGLNRFELVVPARLWDAERERFYANPNLKYLTHQSYIEIEVRNPSTNNWTKDFLGLIDYTHISVTASENVLEVVGESVLGRRMILPESDPAHPSFPVQNPAGRHIIDGIAETEIRALVNEAFGTGATPQRRIPNLFLRPDQGRGPVIKSTARYVNLLGKLTELGQMASIGFELEPDDNGFMFTIVPGQDRTIDSALPVIFDPLMINVESMDYEASTLHRATTFHVLGQGEEEDRAVALAHEPFFVSNLPDNEALNLQKDTPQLPLDGAGARVVINPSEGSVKGLAQLTFEGWVRWDFPKVDGADAADTIFHESVNTAASVADGSPRFRLEFVGLPGARRLRLRFRPDDEFQHILTSPFTLPEPNWPDSPWLWVMASIDLVAEQAMLRVWIPELGQEHVQTFGIAPLQTAFEVSTPENIYFGWHPLATDPDNNLYASLSRWRMWDTVVPFSVLQQTRQLMLVPSEHRTAHGLIHDWRFSDGVGNWVTDFRAFSFPSGGPNGEIKGQNYRWVQSPAGSPGLEESQGLFRREDTVDARDLPDFDQLGPRGLSKFSEQGPKVRLEAQVLPNGPYRYKVHWNLGDVVTIRNAEWGVQTDLRVRRIMITAERGKAPEIRVNFGAPFGDFPTLISRADARINPELYR